MNTHPCTIFSDRYGGCYSGGNWIAVPVYPECVIDFLGGDPNGGDESAMNVWDCLPKDKKVGRGKTPDEALEILEADT